MTYRFDYLIRKSHDTIIKSQNKNIYGSKSNE